ncbi:MAG: homocysteine S-methyltransferase family protein, partial [Pseudomonadales bacterium]|nr:homocysteine S-methyltransferase family protein [Pseudomonadales bacterium]
MSEAARKKSPSKSQIEELLTQRILILDGAYGTAFQGYSLTESDYRNSTLENYQTPLIGNHDLLCLTRPDVVEEVHRAYLGAGADIISTNTFSATSIAQADFGTESHAFELNRAGAAIARRAAHAFDSPDKPRF